MTGGLDLSGGKHIHPFAEGLMRPLLRELFEERLDAFIPYVDNLSSSFAGGVADGAVTTKTIVVVNILAMAPRLPLRRSATVLRKRPTSVHRGRFFCHGHPKRPDSADRGVNRCHGRHLHRLTSPPWQYADIENRCDSNDFTRPAPIGRHGCLPRSSESGRFRRTMAGESATVAAKRSFSMHRGKTGRPPNPSRRSAAPAIIEREKENLDIRASPTQKARVRHGRNRAGRGPCIEPAACPLRQWGRRNRPTTGEIMRGTT